MATKLQIDPDTVYGEGEISLSLDIPTTTLCRERRAGRLRFTRKGRRVLILGRWLLDWLKKEDAQSGSRKV
jgi:hypothetical protein